MRKVTHNAIDAFMAGRNYTGGNTTVTKLNGVTALLLHGNVIATKQGSVIHVTTSGWNTNTTRNRLNGIPGVSVQVMKGELCLNGIVWKDSDTLTKIN